ncbi:MAG TPA: competence protein CoiA family protein [Lentibacillus sp.]|uniref:competence protein CoiA n=1 Tax=Lentibacillus sp. TaxID=1925746 RepID=UPI002B4B76BE|nr:competence protein CoiA family protein [Lentibacillus sp.]HLR61642.1 competence protein CoiA family protein [Lentibacillus sp.]
MLQAKTEYGNIITLASFTQKEISSLKEHTQFFCPACQEPVIAKAGSKMIPHFAHTSKSNCPVREGGEGPYHEKGKLLLYQWLKYQQLDAQLEAYLPTISQRSDILIKLKNKTVAIEYQCARIPSAEIIKRNKGYQREGIVPIWILGANQFNRRKRNEIGIDQFQLHFIHQFSSDFPLTLYFFCPNTLRFISFQDLYFPVMQRAMGKITIRKLNDMVFTDLFNASSFTRQDLFQSWKQEKRSFRIRPSRRMFGRELMWNQWLYANAAHRETLPSIIYLPVSAQFRMKTQPWDWQSRLCLEIIHPIAAGGTFSLQRCMHMLRHHVRHSASFPLINSNANPVYQYLQLLEQLRIIRETAPNHFTKQNPIIFYEHIESALKGDELLLDQFISSS